ncbi:hypothetical protein AB0K40_45620 [Nonomuraea bangladeshensis]|uniref:Uncharacterized protein n=1 Tax=Nonomuraea bangladeshensis TaxID=404385 RepID=A0ABV3HJW3_9ACTN
MALAGLVGVRLRPALLVALVLPGLLVALLLMVALVVPPLRVALMALPLRVALLTVVPGLVSVRRRPLWPGPWRTR